MGFDVRRLRKDLPMIDEAPSDNETVRPSLEHAQEPEQLLISLKYFGFNDQDIAAGTGTDDRTVRRWKKKQPGPKAATHLAEIRNLVLLLRGEETLTDRGIVFWMRHPNRLLEDFSPLWVVAAGGFRSARDSARCFADPDHRFVEPLGPRVLERLEAKAAAAENKQGLGDPKSKKLEPVGS
jgi:hypothetical protein